MSDNQLAKGSPENPSGVPSPPDDSEPPPDAFWMVYGVSLFVGVLLIFGLGEFRIGRATVGVCIVLFSIVGFLSLFVKRKKAQRLANIFTGLGIFPGAIAGFIFALTNSETLGEFWFIKGLASGALLGALALRPLGWLVGLCTDASRPGQELDRAYSDSEADPGSGD